MIDVLRRPQQRRKTVLDVQRDSGNGAASIGGIALLPDRHHQPGRSMGERASLRQVWHHRRRIKTEEKAKVVAAVRGEEFFQFLAALVILARTIFKNKMNSSFSFKSSGCNSSYNSNRPVQNS